jgi:hypothetical protein
MPHEIRGDQDWSAPATPSVRPTMSTDVFSCGMMFAALALPQLYSVLESQVTRLTNLADQFARHDAPRQRPMFGALPDEIATPIWSLVLKMTKFEADERLPVAMVKEGLMAVSQVVQGLGYTSYIPPRNDRATQGGGAATTSMEPVDATSVNVSSGLRVSEGGHSKVGNTGSSDKAVDLQQQAAPPDSSSESNGFKKNLGVAANCIDQKAQSLHAKGGVMRSQKGNQSQGVKIRTRPAGILVPLSVHAAHAVLLERWRCEPVTGLVYRYNM